MYTPHITLQWRHNDHDGVSNHQPHGCLLNHLFRRRLKKTSKLCVTGLCARNSPGTVNSSHKGPVTGKMFPFDDVIMITMDIITYPGCHPSWYLLMEKAKCNKEKYHWWFWLQYSRNMLYASTYVKSTRGWKTSVDFKSQIKHCRSFKLGLHIKLSVETNISISFLWPLKLKDKCYLKQFILLWRH